jgi:hypothetical protein
VNYLGFGVSSYFHVIKVVIFLFFVLTLVNIPVLRVYTSYNNYKDETSDKLFKITSLGNMGFSQTKCTSSYLGTDQIVLSCKTGQINAFVDYGIIPKFENRDQCLRNKSSACDSSYNYDGLKSKLQPCLG